PRPNEPGAIFDERVAYENWQRQFDAARDGAKYLPDLQAVDSAVRASPDRKLMLLDLDSGTQARAAIAIGDPDKATHVSVTTPGLNTTVHGGIGTMTEEATNVRQEALRQLGLTPGHATDSVSTIAWIGYDPPQVPGFDDKTASLSGLWGVTHDDLARAGAHDLARFYDGIQASHLGGPADLTAIGHSYGSLTTGLALQEPGDHGVSRALFYGSPGIAASTPEQLRLHSGQVYAMEAPDDPIQWVYDARAVGQGIPILGSYLNNEFGDFGSNPATNPEVTRLATGAATVPDGHGGTIVLQEAHGHSDYPRFPDGGGIRTTNYNIAAVLAGLGDKAVRGN
uniref:alpha/beta hydrolase n=1 Tax=Mycolicibacter arupensis TaxID=342002 RepID=UPI003B3A1D35